METLLDAARELQWKPFRLRQVHHARETELVSGWDQMTSLPQKDREWLNGHIPFDCLKVMKSEISEDGTAIKWLLETGDKKRIETVLLIHTAPTKKWGTVCISSQIGCPMKCAFCATGKMGFFRNLTADEVLDQFLIAKREAAKQGIVGNLNVVFMGMGEPLLNLEAVIPAIKVLIDPKRYSLSPTRVTVSTSGILPGLKRLFDEKLNIGLALSLHASTHELRLKLMPANAVYPLDEVMKEIRKWEKKTEVLYEYILIEGVNDSPKDARDLLKLLKGRNAKINLIPLNPVEGTGFRRPAARAMMGFLRLLEEGGLAVTLRHTKGDDIKAACGQLNARN
ncbi:23S rRNA (adenine(2503)-C(2))-methyltransferase RlmN [Candidatus Peregrinibacteria bacterium]|nr:23S rRNA (adenine(2503)-C(2))-methyltransferase RlmN [Candidatus Peregrinibacteria bacterium]